MNFLVSAAIVLVGIFLIWRILEALVGKKIAETHGLLWLLPALAIIVGGLFPDLYVQLSRLLDVYYAPSLVFTFAIIILFYLVFRLTVWIANASSRMEELAMQVSLLKMENERLQKRRGEEKSS